MKVLKLKRQEMKGTKMKVKEQEILIWLKAQRILNK